MVCCSGLDEICCTACYNQFASLPSSPPILVNLFLSVNRLPEDKMAHAFDTNCMTLTRFVLQEQKKYKDATGDLSQLLNCIQTAVKGKNPQDLSSSR